VTDERYAPLRAAHTAGAMILANEGRHGRPESYHYLPDPKFTCEPHEYIAVVPHGPVAELLEASRDYRDAFSLQTEDSRWQELASRYSTDDMPTTGSIISKISGRLDAALAAMKGIA